MSGGFCVRVPGGFRVVYKAEYGNQKAVRIYDRLTCWCQSVRHALRRVRFLVRRWAENDRDRTHDATAAG